MNSSEYPTIRELREANKDADILLHQTIGLFSSRRVRFTLAVLQNKRGDEQGNALTMLALFNYGYILGKRAERARRRKK